MRFFILVLGLVCSSSLLAIDGFTPAMYPIVDLRNASPELLIVNKNPRDHSLEISRLDLSAHEVVDFEDPATTILYRESIKQTHRLWLAIHDLAKKTNLQMHRRQKEWIADGEKALQKTLAEPLIEFLRKHVKNERMTIRFFNGELLLDFKKVDPKEEVLRAQQSKDAIGNRSEVAIPKSSFLSYDKY